MGLITAKAIFVFVSAPRTGTTRGQFFIDDIMGLEYESYFGEGSIGSYGFSQDMVEFSNLSFHSNRPQVQHLSDKTAELHRLKN